MTNHENRQFLARREGEITDQKDRLPKVEMPSGIGYHTAY